MELLILKEDDVVALEVFGQAMNMPLGRLIYLARTGKLPGAIRIGSREPRWGVSVRRWAASLDGPASLDGAASLVEALEQHE